MISTLILAVLLPGQVQMRQRQCQTAASYQRQYVLQTPAYQAPAYQTYANTYAPALVTTYFGPAYQDAYYSNVVGAQARIANRRQEEIASTSALTAQVGGLTVAINQLNARLGTVSPVTPAPPPVAPGKPSPEVPGKPTPDVPDKPTPSPPRTAPPPTPKVNPDDGSVPPPPVPSVPGTNPPPAPGDATTVKPPNAAVMAIFTAQCAKCHTAPAKAGKGVVLFSEPGKMAALDGGMLLKLDSEVYSGDMPKASQPLSADDYSKLRAWINDNRDVTDAYLAACKVAKVAAN